LLDKYDSIPIKLKLTQRTNIDEIIKELKASQIANPTHDTLQLIQTMLPTSVALELCKLSNIKPQEMLKNQDGKAKDKLYSLLAWVPLEIIGSYGWQKAMVTRGGVKLKEINPKTMQSKITPNLYFCGEVIDIDGPCGGFNLQWCFSSGYLAGKLKK
jgi:predicted Rossmann fold flavoprotein